MRSLLCFVLLTTSMHQAVAGFVLKQSGGEILYQADEKGPVYKPGDGICFYEQARKVACGKVGKASGQKLIVKISALSKGFNFYQGQELNAKGRASGGSVGAAGSGEVAESSSDHDVFDISAGGVAGTTFFFPLLNFQLALGNRFSLGIAAVWVPSGTGGAAFTALGGELNFNIYFSRVFDDFSIQLGGGVMAITVSNASGTLSESILAIFGTASLQYRLALTDKLDFGLGAGGMYVSGTLNNFTIGLSGILPVGQAFLAYSF
jgi:hypothetical protein